MSRKKGSIGHEQIKADVRKYTNGEHLRHWLKLAELVGVGACEEIVSR